MRFGGGGGIFYLPMPRFSPFGCKPAIPLAFIVGHPPADKTGKYEDCHALVLSYHELSDIPHSNPRPELIFRAPWHPRSARCARWPAQASPEEQPGISLAGFSSLRLPVKILDDITGVVADLL